MLHRFPRSRLVLVATLVAAMLSSCAVSNRIFRNTAAEEQAAALLQLQLSVMRFADEYTARLADQVIVFQQGTANPADRLAAQGWLVSQATAAFTIASGPNPELNAIDMLVFASLSRMVIEDRWVAELYNGRAEGLLAAHRALEERAWRLAEQLLTPAQTSELRSSIDAWHRENPLLRAVPFIHLQDFAFATSRTRAATASTGSVFSFLGIDPLSNLDPAVREIAQTRQLAERAVYYAQRTPKLLSMEVQRLVFELAVMPESVQLLQSVARVSAAAQQTGDLAADLPDLLATERAATIEQLAGVLDTQQGQLQALIVELRSTLEAGTATSDSVKGTIASLDVLLARFDSPPATPGEPRQPFDITQYTETFRQLSETAQQLQVLISQVDGKAPGLAQLSDRATGQVESLVDHVFWRLVQLGLVLIATGLLGALGYRVIVRRWSRRGFGESA
jgi:methyl-accepting chemotaxis protein